MVRNVPLRAPRLRSDVAELVDATKQNGSQHLKNIFGEGELDPAAAVKESLTVQIEGSREVQRPVTLYSLDAILAVGYRVRSPRGVQFRRWASTVLKEYLIKGFVMDDERLKNPDGRPDYFDEMLERIRDIRASEKRFYQKVRDLFALSSDYDKTDSATQQFFATVQNVLLYAVTQRTAAELITARANPRATLINGLTSESKSLLFQLKERLGSYAAKDRSLMIDQIKLRSIGIRRSPFKSGDHTNQSTGGALVPSDCACRDASFTY
jgi:hypothetical protein